MDMEENIKNTELLEEESSIDFGKIFNDLKKHKRLFYKVLPITFVVAAILTLSLPNYYQCTVMLSPEISSNSSGRSSLASLASTFGVNIGMGNAGFGTEALFPTLYPDLVNSTDFKTTLFDVPVTIEGNKEKGEPDRTMTYYDYLNEEQKVPWWSAAIGGTMKAIIGLFVEKKEEKKTIDPFRLTNKQAKETS